MAALDLKQDPTTGTMTLAQKTSARLGSMAFAGLWIGVLLVFLVPSILDNSVDLGTLVFLLVFLGLPTGTSIINGLVATTITIDPANRTLTSVKQLVVVPISASTMAFGDIASLELQKAAASRNKSSNYYRLTAVSRDGKRIPLNWNGGQNELTELAQKIAAATGAPVEQPIYRIPQRIEQTLKRIAPDLEQTIETAAGGETDTGAAPADSSAGPFLAPPVPKMNELSQTGRAEMPPDSPPAQMQEPQAQPMYAPPQMQEPEPAPSSSDYGMDNLPSAEEESTATVDVASLSEAELEQRTKSDPMDSDARYALALKYYARGQADRAIPLYQETARLDPSNAGAQNDLGVALQATGKRADAELAYRRAVALDPFSSLAHLNLALVLRESKRASEASQEFLQARRNARGDVETRAAENASSGAKLAPQLWRP